MIERVHGALSGLLDAAKPSAPPGYGGLLSDEEQQSAQPGRVESLLGRIFGLGSDSLNKSSYGTNLNHLLEMKQLASQVGERKRILDARRAMPDLFPAKPNETMDEMRNRLAGLYSYALAHGDEETLKDVGSTLRGIMTQPKPPSSIQHVPGVGIVDLNTIDPATGKPTVVVESGKEPSTIPGSPEWLAAQEASARIHAKYQYHPENPAQLVTGKDGKTFAYDPRTRTMQEVKTPEGDTFQGAPKGATQTAQNAAAEALLRSSVSEMHNAHSFMKDYENELASGTKSINGLSQFMGGVGNAFTHDDPASRAIQNTALTVLNKMNPDLARYIRRGLSFAEGEAGISKRPSDFRTKMAAFLSTAASGASPDMIHDIQGRRTSILNPLQDVVANMGTKTSTPSIPSGKTPHLDAYRHLLK